MQNKASFLFTLIQFSFKLTWIKILINTDTEFSCSSVVTFPAKEDTHFEDGMLKVK